MSQKWVGAVKWTLLYRVGHSTAKLRYEISKSGYFNAEWYLSHYAELLNDPEAVGDPLGHFLSKGVSEQRNPGPGFNTEWYLEEYEDVRASGMNPLVHYLRHGRQEERWPTPYLGGMQGHSSLFNDLAQYRVIYRTRRRLDLSHLDRVKRLDSASGVQAWRIFSQGFRQSSQELTQSDAEYLHNRGFLPTRKKLYQLPNNGVDAYLSDLQVALLPLANGYSQQLLETPVLQAQLFQHQLAMVPQSGSNVSGQRLKVLLIKQPATGQLVPLAAVVHRDSSTAIGNMSVSMNLSIRSGRVRSVAYYHAEKKWLRLRRALPWERYRYRSIWRSCVHTLLPVVRQASNAAFVQVDIDVSNSGLRLIRLHGKPQVETFQVHGPLMSSETAIDFLREYGL